MEQQGRRVRQLRRRRRSTRRRAVAAGAGRAANRHCAQPNLDLDVYRLRELQRLQAGSDAREGCQLYARPGHSLGRSVENAAGETSTDCSVGALRELVARIHQHNETPADCHRTVFK